jgi:hypothetical protein
MKLFLHIAVASFLGFAGALYVHDAWRSLQVEKRAVPSAAVAVPLAVACPRPLPAALSSWTDADLEWIAQTWVKQDSGPPLLKLRDCAPGECSVAQ